MPAMRAPRTADPGGGNTRFSTRTDSMALMDVSVDLLLRGTVEAGTVKPLTDAQPTAGMVLTRGRLPERREGETYNRGQKKLIHAPNQARMHDPHPLQSSQSPLRP